MSQAAEVVDLLKAALKARGITYAELARRVGQSEASVKRWFAQRNFTLARLDRIGFIELMPNNRIRLRVARTFSWTPNGPIMEALKDNVADFFASDFAGTGEAMFLLNGRFTPGARHALAERLKKLAREFAELHWGEGALPQSERQPVSLLLACRPWQVAAIRPFIRTTPQRNVR